MQKTSHSFLITKCHSPAEVIVAEQVGSRRLLKMRRRATLEFDLTGEVDNHTRWEAKLSESNSYPVIKMHHLSLMQSGLLRDARQPVNGRYVNSDHCCAKNQEPKSKVSKEFLSFSLISNRGHRATKVYSNCNNGFVKWREILSTTTISRWWMRFMQARQEPAWFTGLRTPTRPKGQEWRAYPGSIGER